MKEATEQAGRSSNGHKPGIPMKRHSGLNSLMTGKDWLPPEFATRALKNWYFLSAHSFMPGELGNTIGVAESPTGLIRRQIAPGLRIPTFNVHWLLLAAKLRHPYCSRLS
ncbi:hypothetical protein MAF45_09575 [Mesosutterella sp. OilRF-GAM-744-9]|uniref:Uncharacterized protein n=1 Tax=Mesosutterella porci TaxID=2915351 RepID=A0ABS9MTG7_9BURK|nr:hypothetical protein [Mesosutterella sp. oilRF-744-WT-GAM-9]MCG5031687.1 hypothetical protein [Mesosutterella sp. oilRF-744-WT-GAM-9]